MAIEILYKGIKPVEWRYFRCTKCKTVWRDDSDYTDAEAFSIINGATHVYRECPICGMICEDITRDEALMHVPSGQNLFKECIDFRK